MQSNQRVTTDQLLAIIDNQSYGVEYQPIIDIKTMDLFAYEALARFVDHDRKLIAPDKVFNALQSCPLTLFQVECTMKQLQVDMAPADVHLFLNLDQEAFKAYGSMGPDNPIVEVIAGREKAVTEIIENTRLSHAEVSQAMLETFAEAGVELALDDIGATNSVLSLDVMAGVNYLKLDANWLKKLDTAPYKELLHSLISFAHAVGKKVVLEGVEYPEQLAMAKKLGVDFIQGFYFRDLNLRRFS